MGPVGPRWTPCWPHEPRYQGRFMLTPSRMHGFSIYNDPQFMFPSPFNDMITYTWKIYPELSKTKTNTAVGIRYAYYSAPIISCQHGIFTRLVWWYFVLHSQFVCTCLLIFWIGYVLCTSIFLYITHMIFLSIWLSFYHVQIKHRRYVYFFL